MLAVPATYSLARLTGRWGEHLSIGIFLTYLVPSTLLFIPFSRLVALLGLQNQLGALVLIYPTFTVPFCTWLLMGFFKTLPKEVEESAMVDGCSRLGAIGRVVLPLAMPGLLTVVIFALTVTIQEFVYSLTYLVRGADDGERGRARRPRAGRRLLLGILDGGVSDHERATGRHLQLFSRPLHRRLHRRRDQVAAGRSPLRRPSSYFQ